MTAATLPPPSPGPDATIAVGFAGLGAMGAPLARNLAASGVPLLVYNRTQSKAEALAGPSVKWSPTPRDLARSVGKGVTLAMLSDGPAVKALLFGRAGYARGAPAGALFANLATIDPEESRAFAARLAEKGIHYVDAPVGGSTDLAESRGVTFYVGGEAEDVVRVRPLLERIGRRVEPVGGVGAGNAMKLVNNLLTIGITALSAEALSLAAGLSLDPKRTVELLLAGGGRSAMLERKAERFLARQYAPQFASQLARKDLKLIERAAARGGRPVRMTREARRLLDEAIVAGHGADDFSSVLEATLARAQPPSGPKGTAGPAGRPMAPAGSSPQDQT